MRDVCDAAGCDAAVAWLVFASFESGAGQVYPTESGAGEVYPTVIRYPAAMARACNDHLAERLTADGQVLGGSPQYVVRRVRSS